MILVTGASGKIGGSLARMLASRGLETRGLVRGSSAADLGEGVERVVADYGDGASLDRALSGVDGIFLMAPVPLLAEHATAMAAAVRRSDVRRVVLLSSMSVEMDHGNLFREEHAAAERAVMALDRDWTVLRAGELMSNALGWAPSIRSSRLVEPFVRNVPCARIDPSDVAAVAARVLTDAGGAHAGKIHALTGGEATTPESCAAVLAELLGVELRYSELDDEQAERAWIAIFGETAAARERIRALRETDLPWLAPRDTTRTILERQPLAFRDWAIRNLPVFE